MALQPASRGIRWRARMLMRYRRSDSADADVLEFGELQDAVLRAFTAGATLFHATERRDLGRDQPGIESDDAVLERLGDPPGARQVSRVKVCRESELGVV